MGKHLGKFFNFQANRSFHSNRFSIEIIGLASVSTFIVEKLRNSVKRVLDDALKGIETSNYELEFRTKSEESRYLLGKIKYPSENVSNENIHHLYSL